MPREASSQVSAGSPQSGELLRLEVREGVAVSGRLIVPPGARALYVLAHGAGAGMDHPSLSSTAADLAALGIATLRYQFPYMEQRKGRPDPPAVCHATVRAAVAEAARRAPQLPTFAGGRSFGGRMTSQAQAQRELPGVRGLVLLGFPLHAAKQPADERARHLGEVHIPMLFVQGTRDALAERTLMHEAVARLGSRATLAWVEDADHSFHVPARSGRSDAEVRRALLGDVARWMAGLL
jgi:predicted alpha/beta-hydrolase family hydrolase